MSYLSDIEKYARKDAIADLCEEWKNGDDILLYLSIAVMWPHNVDLVEELSWLSLVYQAGRNL